MHGFGALMVLVRCERGEVVRDEVPWLNWADELHTTHACQSGR